MKRSLISSLEKEFKEDLASNMELLRFSLVIWRWRIVSAQGKECVDEAERLMMQRERGGQEGMGKAGFAKSKGKEKGGGIDAERKQTCAPFFT